MEVYLKYTYNILLESTLQVYLKYTGSVLQVYFKKTDLISQNVPQMYFFCRNKIDLKYASSSSVIQQVEVCLKYTSSNLKYISKVFFTLV